MNYEVGQPVSFKALWLYLPETWFDGVYLGYDHRSQKHIVKWGYGSLSSAKDEELRPRPTLYWSIRQWFMSKFGK